MMGVIGPDGAGKTTTLRMICGLIAPDAGTVRVLGVDPFRVRRDATAAIGYLSQRFSLYGDLSIDENIAFFARIHGVWDFDARRQRLLELTGLHRFRDRLADRLSGGMKQKLALACTLVHEPPVLVLDEPTTGVDPVSRREFWKLLAEFQAQGLTMVMATPYLDEAERCTRVALLHEGRLLAQDEPAHAAGADGRGDGGGRCRRATRRVESAARAVGRRRACSCSAIASTSGSITASRSRRRVNGCVAAGVAVSGAPRRSRRHSKTCSSNCCGRAAADARSPPEGEQPT